MSTTSSTTDSAGGSPEASRARFCLIVDAVEWERTKLQIRGDVACTDPEQDSGARPGADFVDTAREHAWAEEAGSELHSSEVFLEEAESYGRARIREFELAGGRFNMTIDVFFAAGGDPLETGIWAVRVVTTDGTVVPVRMSPALAIPAYAYGGVLTVRGGRYWLMPARDPESDLFVLAVNHRKNPRATETDSLVGRLLARARRRLKLMWAWLFRAVYGITRRLVRRNGKRIMFTSDSRASLSGNLKMVRDRMQTRGLEGEYTFWYLFKPSVKDRRPLLDKLRLPYYLAAADIILLDDYHPTLYKVEFDPSVRIIQLWHASGAFKTVGYSRIGKPGGPNPFSRAHKNYTYAIVSSAHDVPHYAEAFGIDESRVIPTGIPRMDVFFDPAHRERAIRRAHKALPGVRDHEVILFAPTFRGKGPSDAHYDYDLLDFEALHALCVERDAVVVFKMHPFVIEPLEIPEHLRDRLIDASHVREINDLLFVADLVITDYSSLVFEYCTLGRPMLFFAYDLEEYVSSRDFYEGFEEFVPGRIVHTFDELLDAVRAQEFEIEKVAAFAAEHLAATDGTATDRVIDELIVRRADR